MSYQRYRAVVDQSQTLSLDELDKMLFDILTNNELSAEESSVLLAGLLEVVRKNTQHKVTQT